MRAMDSFLKSRISSGAPEYLSKGYVWKMYMYIYVYIYIYVYGYKLRLRLLSGCETSEANLKPNALAKQAKPYSPAKDLGDFAHWLCGLRGDRSVCPGASQKLPEGLSLGLSGLYQFFLWENCVLHRRKGTFLHRIWGSRVNSGAWRKGLL